MEYQDSESSCALDIRMICKMNNYILDEYEEINRNMNKVELRKEISNLRTQFAALEKRCKEREDKLLQILHIFIQIIEMTGDSTQQKLLTLLEDSKL